MSKAPAPRPQPPFEVVLIRAVLYLIALGSLAGGFLPAIGGVMRQARGIGPLEGPDAVITQCASWVCLSVSLTGLVVCHLVPPKPGP